jgi:quercetin dioxygenase-like cupin family protein
MARPGDVLAHPRGDRLVFIATAADTGGERLEMDVTYPRRTHAPAPHLHPHQEETFRVLQGALRTTIDGRERTFGPGEAFVVPPGTPHTMHADADEPTRFLWEVRPALRTEDFFETIWGLARAGRTNARGTPTVLQGAVLMRAYAAEFRLVRPPRFVQRPLFAVLAAIGRALGYRARYAPGEPLLERRTTRRG